MLEMCANGKNALEISEELKLSKTTIYMHIYALERDGLIERITDNIKSNTYRQIRSSSDTSVNFDLDYFYPRLVGLKETKQPDEPIVGSLWVCSDGLYSWTKDKWQRISR